MIFCEHLHAYNDRGYVICLRCGTRDATY